MMREQNNTGAKHRETESFQEMMQRVGGLFTSWHRTRKELNVLNGREDCHRILHAFHRAGIATATLAGVIKMATVLSGEPYAFNLAK